MTVYGKKTGLRILQGSPDARMARQQVGTGRSRENFRKRAGSLQRAVSKHSVGVRESAVAGTTTTCHRRHNPPRAVSGRPSTDRILSDRLRQDTSATCGGAHKLGPRELRPDNVKPTKYSLIAFSFRLRRPSSLCICFDGVGTCMRA